MNKNETKRKNVKGKQTKEKVKKTFDKNKLIIFAIKILLIALATGACYYFEGKYMALILGVLLLIAFFFGWLLDRPRKKKKHKVLKIFLIIFLFLGIVALCGCGYFLYYIVKNAPSFEAELLKTKEATVIYDSKGVEIAKIGTEIRENIEYDQLSEVFVDALVATEDSRFFQHNGFDLMRFIKAAGGQVLGHSDAGGGSTLTMQVAKNTFTDASVDSGIKGIIRKFTDIYISIYQIERNYTKEEIVEFYTNNHNLSGTIYGVQEASQSFFGKDACDLTLAEASIIAGMYQAPTSYNPFNHPEAASKRRDTVLYLMEKHGYITEEERKLAASIPVESLLTDSSKKVNPYQGYIDMVCEEVQERYGVDPYATPMLIYTNMITKKQDGINKIMDGKTFKWKYKKLQAGIAVINSNNGKIEAIGAGRNRTGAKTYNYATDTNRQIGSTAKPLFDYGPGMEYNNWSTYTLFKDEPYTYSNGKTINNFDGSYHGTVTLRTALSKSYNVPALKAFQQVDNKKIIDLVTSVGITPEISNGYIHEAHAIGSFTGSNPLTMAGAYQIFSNGGYFYEPFAVNKVVFRDTGETDTYASTKVRIISDSTAYMITDVLKGVPSDAAKNGLTKDYFAMKTGTTNVDSETKRKQKLSNDIIRDYWVDGYTHDVVVSIWIGFDNLSRKSDEFLHYSLDSGIRERLFNVTAKAVFNHDNKDFSRPSSVVSAKVEKKSNPAMMPSSATPKDQIVVELFRRGTEPSEVSNKYRDLAAPTGLYVSYNKTYNHATITWNPVKDEEYVEDGVFGYYIYFEGTRIAFTQNTSYTLSNMDNYYGQYAVRAGYKDTSSCLSPMSYFTLLREKNYKLSLTGQKSVTYNINEAIDEDLYNGKIVKLTEDGTDITSSASISKNIVSASKGSVSNIDNTVADTYTITYNVKYGSFSDSISNTIIIK